MATFFPELAPLITAMDLRTTGSRWKVLRLLVLAPQILRGLTAIFRENNRFKGVVQVSMTPNLGETGWVYGSFDSLVIRYSLGKSMLQVMDVSSGLGVRSARCLVRCFDHSAVD